MTDQMANRVVQCLLFFVLACQVRGQEATLATVSTPNQYSYQWVNGLSPCRNNVVFSVQACNDAFIALAEGTEGDSRLYEILIGGWSNTQSAIRKAKQGDPVASFHHQPLDCGAARDFWVSWENGVIAVGTGSLPGQGEFMRYRDPTPYSVKYVGVSTGWGSTGKFIFKDVPQVHNGRQTTEGNRGLHETLSTSVNVHFQYLRQDFINFDCQQYVRFDVTACNDAHVALSESDNPNIRTYEIAIGGWGNTQSAIRRCKDCPEVARYMHSNSPLSCTEARSFWVSWNGNRIAVGTGQNVGANVFMFYQDGSPYSVHRVGFSTGWGATGNFRVKA